MTLQDRMVKHSMVVDRRLSEHLEAVRTVMQRDELVCSIEEGRRPRVITDDDVWNHLHDKWVRDLETGMMSEVRDGVVKLRTQMTVRSTVKFDRTASQLGFKGRVHFQRFILDHDRRNNGWEEKD